MLINDDLEILAKYPVLGVIFGVGGFLVTYIEPINDLLKFVSLGLGIVVAILTIYAKILEIKKRKK